MIVLEDRQRSAQWIEAAQDEGARLKPACEVAGIDTRTCNAGEHAMVWSAVVAVLVPRGLTHPMH